MSIKAELAVSVMGQTDVFECICAHASLHSVLALRCTCRTMRVLDPLDFSDQSDAVVYQELLQEPSRLPSHRSESNELHIALRRNATSRELEWHFTTRIHHLGGAMTIMEATPVNARTLGFELWPPQFGPDVLKYHRLIRESHRILGLRGMDWGRRVHDHGVAFCEARRTLEQIQWMRDVPILSVSCDGIKDERPDYLAAVLLLAQQVFLPLAETSAPPPLPPGGHIPSRFFDEHGVVCSELVVAYRLRGGAHGRLSSSTCHQLKYSTSFKLPDWISRLIQSLSHSLHIASRASMRRLADA